MGDPTTLASYPWQNNTTPPGTQSAPQSVSYLSPSAVPTMGHLEWRHDATLQQQHAVGPAQGAARLHKAEIRALLSILPTHAHTCNGKCDNEDHQQCSICLEDYEEGDDVIVLRCLHRFHSHCVTSWMLRDKHAACPMCKRAL